MPIGVIINSLSIFLGGLIGGSIGDKLSSRFKAQINLIFGVCSMGMGISSIGLMKYMPAVIFAIVIGTGVGLFFHLEDWINKSGLLMQKAVDKVMPNAQTELSHDDFLAALLTIIVLFCASGTGIYGSLDAGMTGDFTVLISKSVLDFFTAAIFACSLGYVVSFIAIPQFIIFACLFYLAGFIVPLTTADMIADFKACGGFLMLATGFRMVQIKMFPTADMIPAMIIVMPLSHLWAQFILPLL
ncbi:DUF554 domain-containing protein [Streptococcus chenjunshii]|uniref:DUF554 domain-containing protein n=1 Tax=Streptococcus chenjunshii TaxID=2173853 RepID=A0A372KM13_9STRE|nr:DUF554 domain-containing protein [Streptococcus chenjunshii]AXQ79096.1 DUF554 domain-containing protein [Streptococcus chenjunshii]RFU50291.1 DUF554 domain-containing protein [Streptococcus chenjunshii]RFU53322.1 DUF554 domain-containing protein [Streptococcus chenjunshii]